MTLVETPVAGLYFALVQPGEGAAAEATDEIDHITLNLPAIEPFQRFLVDRFGFEARWDIAVEDHGASGAGLRSRVLVEPRSGLRLALNEPLPRGAASGQTARFLRDNGGGGVQHLALGVPRLRDALAVLRRRGAGLVPPPPGAPEAMRAQLDAVGWGQRPLGAPDDTPAALIAAGALVDASAEGRALAQVFALSAAEALGEPTAGPFFYEYIQRCGEPGFLHGNFRALFAALAARQAGRG
jgi:4-hydroxyphenylpyruvate dioxygenase